MKKLINFYNQLEAHLLVCSLILTGVCIVRDSLCLPQTIRFQILCICKKKRQPACARCFST